MIIDNTKCPHCECIGTLIFITTKTYIYIKCGECHHESDTTNNNYRTLEIPETEWVKLYNDWDKEDSKKQECLVKKKSIKKTANELTEIGKVPTLEEMIKNKFKQAVETIYFEADDLDKKILEYKFGLFGRSVLTDKFISIRLKLNLEDLIIKIDQLTKKIEKSLM